MDLLRLDTALLTACPTSPSGHHGPNLEIIPMSVQKASMMRSIPTAPAVRMLSRAAVSLNPTLLCGDRKSTQTIATAKTATAMPVHASHPYLGAVLGTVSAVAGDRRRAAAVAGVVGAAGGVCVVIDTSSFRTLYRAVVDHRVL